MKPAGAVYAMTNAATNNEVVAFVRNHDGTLSLMKAYRTGGSGTGTREVSPATPNDGIDPLASQGSLTLSADKRLLFAVNAGSNSVSSFRRSSDGELTLADVVPSGGLQPNSLDVCRDVLYVSHVGSSANEFTSNITGFGVSHKGRLTRIPDSKRSLSTRNAQPACVVFNYDCGWLVVSELTTNRLSVFQVKDDGTLSQPTVNNSSGSGPFGSVFLSSGPLLVSEAGTNALSSYVVCPNGRLDVVSGSVRNGQMATCWVVPTPDECFAYTSSTGSGTITTYRIDRAGTLQLMESIPSTPDGLGAPIDSGVSTDGLNFYVLNGNQGSISVFRIGYCGRLARLQVKRNRALPDLGSQGLAVC